MQTQYDGREMSCDEIALLGNYRGMDTRGKKMLMAESNDLLLQFPERRKTAANPRSLLLVVSDRQLVARK